jgi:hypothetical protein
MTKIYKMRNDRFVTECPTDTLLSVLAGLPSGAYETWAESADGIATCTIYLVKAGRASFYARKG